MIVSNRTHLGLDLALVLLEELLNLHHDRVDLDIFKATVSRGKAFPNEAFDAVRIVAVD